MVDGIQRLSALVRFMDPETAGMPPLRLCGLDHLQDFHGHGYQELTRRSKIRLRETHFLVAGRGRSWPSRR